MDKDLFAKLLTQITSHI